jgi:hypothetical protein
MRTRSTVPTLVVLVTAGLLGACGGGGDDDGVASLSGAGSDGEGSATSTTLSEEEQQEAMLDWAECMRGHGLDVPDPQFGEDGEVMIQVGGGAGDDEGDGGDSGPGPGDREAFEAAREECGDPPALGTFSEEDREQMEEDALEFSECMRAEGIEDFPDPDFSDFGPGRGPVTNEETVDEDDADDDGSGARVFGPWGEIDLDDPETAAAFEACQEEVGGPGARSGPPMAATGRADT